MPSFVRAITFTRDVLKGRDFEIGEFTYGVPRVQHHPGTRLKIGKFCTIAQEVTIQLGGNQNLDRVTTCPFAGFPDNWREAAFLPIREVWGFSKGDVVISNDVWTGFGAIILSGVTIRDGAVVGAGVVVAKDVEPCAIVAGNPPRVVRKRFDDTISKLLKIPWWDWPVDKIKKHMPIIMGTDIAKLLALDASREN
ncbi:MAG: CatB-related O-acetyltransferase [Dehalococcoidia bacterium]|nr:CatB-related O-acetyltransferase [Dehalococcoidia bacterium]